MQFLNLLNLNIIKLFKFYYYKNNSKMKHLIFIIPMIVDLKIKNQTQLVNIIINYTTLF